MQLSSALLERPLRTVNALAAGEGKLHVARVEGRSEAIDRSARSPLHVYATRTRDTADGASCVWAYLTGLGGGLVDGDAVSLDLSVGEGARAFVGTQSSTKAYRGARGTSQTVRARVAKDALLAWLPEPTTPFADATFAQRSQVTLDAGGSVVWLDALTAGRTARGERWDFARYRNDTVLTIEGAERARDAQLLDRAHGDLRARMGRFDAIAALWLAGPLCREAISLALAPERARASRDADRYRIAHALEAPGGLCVVRYAALSAQSLAELVHEDLACLMSLLGDDPMRRRP